jgi:hypothetical protein
MQSGNPNTMSMWCSITNVSSKPITVTAVELLSTSGAVIISLDVPFDLAPLETAATFQYNVSNSICRFSVNAGAKAVRASACVNQLNVGCIATTPAE